jgi:hypothetical protein
VKDHYLESVLEVIASLNAEGPHLITVDELRAAGALDVPAAWRKSLGVERDLFSDLFGDDDTAAKKQKPTPRDADGKVIGGRTSVIVGT